ncbi:molecular chaperone DnaJ, partial [Salmonella enterica subsp. enterica serovar Sandiego]|nr:molecular chaperone DnaJ [Salmonella enterica subsp. enterica serovar Sandiego]
MRDGLNEELDLARIALASLEAEPIGAFHIEDQQVSGTTDYIKDGEWPIDNGVIEVYAVPPAPVVPEEMPKGLAGQIVSLLVHNIGDKFLAQKIWNACHAALLQGSQPVSNCDELQVIGWLRSDYNSDDKRDPNAPLFMLGRNDPSDAWGVKY